MGDLLSMKVRDAYKESLSDDLANRIWTYKHPREDVDVNDREYVSWLNSLPRFLECAYNANLDDVLVVFEMKTPISNKAIDLLLIGKTPEGEPGHHHRRPVHQPGQPESPFRDHRPGDLERSRRPGGHLRGGRRHRRHADRDRGIPQVKRS